MLWGLLLLSSIIWISYRIYHLSQTPCHTLEECLGYDIPSAPEISVGGVWQRSALIYWLNSRESSLQAVTLAVLVNGVKVGSFSRKETAVEIQGLKPQSSYIVKVTATNIANMINASPPMRIMTLPSSMRPEGQDGLDSQGSGLAVLRTSAAPIDFSAPAFTSLGCETSLSSRNENSDSGQSPSMLHLPSVSSVSKTLTPKSDVHSSTEVDLLAFRLESAKKQKAEVEKQIRDEDIESASMQLQLSRQRDLLRGELREKEEASADLKKHGNQLDKLNRSAQSRRAAKQRLLLDKRRQHQKVHDDIEKRNQEIQNMWSDIQEMEQELKDYETVKIQEIVETETAITKLQESVKFLEDEIHVKGAQIKDLEGTKNSQSQTNVVLRSVETSGMELEEQTRESRFQIMQAQLQSVWQALQHSRMEEQHAEEHLSWWIERRVKSPEHFSAVSLLDYYNPQLPMSLQNTLSDESTRTGMLNSPSAIPAFSDYAGAAHVAPGAMMSSELEFLTGGALMSPAANELLPSNLLRDDEALSQPDQAPAPTDKSLDPMNRQLPGYALHETGPVTHEDHSPVSAGSRRDSSLVSPRESAHNLSMFPPGSDNQLLNSANASLDPAVSENLSQVGGGRFVNMFMSPFGRQRSKIPNPEPPALGSLKSGHSQSFPSQSYHNVEESATGSLRRRKGGHALWPNSVAGFLTRTHTNTGHHLFRARPGSSGSDAGHPFQPDADSSGSDIVVGRNSNWRQDTSSFPRDQRPSRSNSEKHEIWRSFPESIGSQAVHLTSGRVNGSFLWPQEDPSHMSLPLASPSTLSLNSSRLDAAEGLRQYTKQRTEQAPIGTRPHTQRQNAPRLNPAAPSFKTLFTRNEGRKVSKDDKAPPKMQGSPTGKYVDLRNAELVETIDDTNGINLRLSRDGHSIKTAASTTDSHDSWDRPGGNADNSPHKESFMQKITRKSSSSKFNVPWPKDRGLFSKKTGEPVASNELEDDNAAEWVNKPAEKPAGTQVNVKEEKGNKGWPGVRRKNKKGTISTDKDLDPMDPDPP